MQVIQTVNDTIRILFSPIDEDFKLLDFLLVQEADNKYLAQIIEIYDDKYDASQNVARVKLFFKVNDKGEVFGYDHFTPSKECEITKIKRDEILNFINEDKESLTIGLDYQSGEPFDINLDFLKNNPVIFADKIEHANNISLHFASALSRYNKHSVIFDFSGTLEIKKAKRLVLTKDVKLPLDFNSVNYVWEKGLATASLETQAICREIFNEIQTFAKSTPEGFIPYNKFLDVIEIQYKATPIVELTVLLNKLNAYQKSNIFANSKKDFEGIEKTVNENDITIIDFSELKTGWHKEFCEFVIRNIKNAFVFVRLNETNTDVDLINFIYDKNPSVTLVPSISYTFSKMPHIVERADNYILLPTLNPRRDFGAANFELTSISKDECILFGKNTENFIFTIKNDKFEDSEVSDTKSQKTIRLNFNEGQTKESLKEKFKNINISESTYENPTTEQVQIPTEEELDFFEQTHPQDNTEEEKTLAKKPEESNVEQHYEQEENQELTPDEILQEQAQQVDEVADIVETAQNETTIEDPAEAIIEEEVISENIVEEENPIEESLDEVQHSDVPEQEILTQEPAITEEAEEPAKEELTEIQDIENIQTQEEDAQNQTGFQNILEDIEQEQAQEEDEPLSLEDLAAQSVENAFMEAIESKSENIKQENPADTEGKLVVDENVVIDLEKIKDHIDTDKGSELPIFKNNSEKKEKIEFKTGDKVEHDKYGAGEVVKVINYANRSLLQINFSEVGKRLLDPSIANIRELKE